MAFVDEHRGEYGVEPICRELRIAPSTYYEARARKRDPGRVPARTRRDEVLKQEIQRVHGENHDVYGAEKIWRELGRQGVRTARCTVERLMRDLGLRGTVRGQTIRTTVADETDLRPMDLVDRDFSASRPSQLSVSDFTHLATCAGFGYSALGVDVFWRRIVGIEVTAT